MKIALKTENPQVPGGALMGLLCLQLPLQSSAPTVGARGGENSEGWLGKKKMKPVRKKMKANS